MIKQLNINIDTYIDEHNQIQKIIKQLNKLNRVNIDFSISEDELESLITYYISHNTSIDLVDYEGCIYVQNKELTLEIHNAQTQQEYEYIIKTLRKHFGVDLSNTVNVEDVLRIMFISSCDYNYVNNKYNPSELEVILTFDSDNLDDNWVFSYYQHLASKY